MKTDRILGDPLETRLHAPSKGARRTTGARIGWGGPYYDFRMYLPPHHPEEDTEKQPKQITGTLPLARSHGPPHVQGPKASEGGADRRLRRQGGWKP